MNSKILFVLFTAILVGCQTPQSPVPEQHTIHLKSIVPDTVYTGQNVRIWGTGFERSPSNTSGLSVLFASSVKVEPYSFGGFSDSSYIGCTVPDNAISGAI